jgi:hypothetical protein
MAKDSLCILTETLLEQKENYHQSRLQETYKLPKFNSKLFSHVQYIHEIKNTSLAIENLSREEEGIIQVTLIICNS